MTLQPVQRTRFEGLIRRGAGGVLRQLRRSWRAASLSLLSLLLGFYLAQNLTSLLMVRLPGGRPSAALMMVLLVEVMVRLRTRLLRGDPGNGWVIVDNFRVGAIYAIVLEAFKLGT